MFRRGLVLCFTLGGVASLGLVRGQTTLSNSPEALARAESLFHEKVWPILKTKCLGCHGEGEKLSAALDLRTREAMLKGGESGPALAPGKATASLLLQAIERRGDLRMPPKEKDRLPPEEIAHFRSWIDAGAPWPKNPVLVKKAEWSSSAEDRWAYQPLRAYAPPKLSKESSSQTSIDAFIQEKLTAKGLALASQADRRVLIRRAAFDLLGLPPTPEQVDAFVKDDAADAFARLVDKLLAAPQYGEQMARHWLDVVRYADTSGFANDFERPNAWRYRDYVIRAFNQDKPFERFILEQIAGDELDASDPEMLIAAGFLRMGPWEQTGMSVKTVTRQQFLDDVTNSVGVTFLAQGLRCARCHDHKFDPIPTRDYYRMQAVFAPVQFAEREAAFVSSESTVGFTQAQDRPQRLIKETQARIAAIRRKHDLALADFLKQRGVNNVNDLAFGDRPRQHFGLTAQEMGLEKVYRKRSEYLQRELLRYQPLAFSVFNGPVYDYSSNKVLNPLPKVKKGPTQEVFILKGGAVETPTDKVSAGVLSAVAYQHGIPEQEDGRRLALARWIASPKNPLTARVIVNRVWQMHFGRGLAATPNNFGKMGRRPTHPELLDWLAGWFIDNGWSVKKLHRLIMTSAVYRQSGRREDIDKVRQVDPNNDLLAYFPQRRLTAEEIRDGMLAITGELNPLMGGPGTFPEIHWEVALQPRHIMGSVAPAYQPSPKPEQRNRRTIYAFRYRTLQDPLLEVFNRPDSDTSCERREETTVTPQAFALLNDQIIHNRALALARRLEKLTGDGPTQIEHAFRLVFGRSPTGDETKLCLDHVARMTAHHRQHAPRPASLPTTVKRRMVEELTGEPFEWEEELDLMKGYQRDLMPWDVGPETRGLAEVCLVLLNANEFLYVE